VIRGSGSSEFQGQWRLFWSVRADFELLRLQGLPWFQSHRCYCYTSLSIHPAYNKVEHKVQRRRETHGQHWHGQAHGE